MAKSYLPKMTLLKSHQEPRQRPRFRTTVTWINAIIGVSGH